jgi:hypothetical protein
MFKSLGLFVLCIGTRVGRFLTKILILKIPETGEKICEVTIGLRKGHDLSVKNLIRVQKFVLNLGMLYEVLSKSIRKVFFSQSWLELQKDIFHTIF